MNEAGLLVRLHYWVEKEGKYGLVVPTKCTRAPALRSCLLLLASILLHPLLGLFTPRIAILALMIFGLPFRETIGAKEGTGWICFVGKTMPAVMDKPLNGENSPRGTIRFKNFQLLAVHIRSVNRFSAYFTLYRLDAGVHSEFLFEFTYCHNLVS